MSACRRIRNSGGWVAQMDHDHPWRARWERARDRVSAFAWRITQHWRRTR